MKKPSQSLEYLWLIKFVWMLVHLRADLPSVCYRFVPEGAAWTREDGAVFIGEMIAPHKDITAALSIQNEYDHMEENAGDYTAAYEEGVQSA